MEARGKARDVTKNYRTVDITSPCNSLLARLVKIASERWASYSSCYTEVRSHGSMMHLETKEEQKQTSAKS